MTYLFLFCGEFGFELFNWQGVVRKFATQCDAYDRILCASRGNVSQFYESADRYIDIGALPSFKNTVACEYFAIPEKVFQEHGPLSIRRAEVAEHGRRLQADVVEYVQTALGVDFHESEFRVIPSFERTQLRGCIFGSNPELNLTAATEGNIYEHLNLENNVFCSIPAHREFQSQVEEQLGLSLKDPFLLVQTRSRRTPQGSPDVVQLAPLLNLIKERIPVALLSFHTGRLLDSYSDLAEQRGFSHFTCSSFIEQSCLIDCASHCLFASEGDFGSHTYVPPFLGRDVTALAPWSVYQNGTTPIDFWNEKVFRFGGQIFPLVAEDVFFTEDGLRQTAEAIWSRCFKSMIGTNYAKG